MIIGETITLVATITPSNASDKQLTWSSSKQSVATITQEGVVTAISEGEAIITASAGGKQGTCAVTVAAPAPALSVICKTDDATDITHVNAVIKGSAIISAAKEAEALCRFYISPTGGEITSLLKNGKVIDAGSIPSNGGSFSAVVDNLEPETEYYYVAEVSIDSEKSQGEVKSFITDKKPLAPTITGAATEITEISAKLSGYANPTPEMGSITMGILLSTDENPSLENGVELTSKELDENNMYVVSATELIPGTTYYYKSFLQYGGVYRSGEVKSFKTLDVNASVTTEDAEIGIGYAVFSGNCIITSTNNLPVTASFFISKNYDNVEDLSSMGDEYQSQVNDDGSFAKTISIDGNSTYYYAAAIDVYGIRFYGEVKTFTTGLFTPTIKLTPDEIYFESGANSQSISLFANRDWLITSELPNWVSLSTTSGYADATKEQTISVTVLENNGYNREASITFSIGISKCSLSIIQSGTLGEIPLGSGTQEDPYSIHGVIKYVETLGADVPSTNDVFVKGIISSVVESFEANKLYGNASFYIVDADVCEESFYVYRTLFLGNRKWTSGETDVKEGDEVVICGRVVNYKGNSPETVNRASYIYSLNGETAVEVDYNTVPAKTVKEFIEAADVNNYYKLTGKVSNFNATYCSFDLTDETGSIYVYSVDNKADWSSKVANEGTVTLAASMHTLPQGNSTRL